jgi:CDP-diacylglycerol--glycerol-3-phosphate 3-phosphatidyltransferase
MVLGDVGMIYAVMLAMAGSLMISYTRARAEALGIECSIGLMQRAERVLLIGLAALIFGEANAGVVLKGVLVGLAVLTNLTVIQRIWWVYRNTRPSGVAVGRAIRRDPSDRGPNT